MDIHRLPTQASSPHFLTAARFSLGLAGTGPATSREWAAKGMVRVIGQGWACHQIRGKQH